MAGIIGGESVQVATWVFLGNGLIEDNVVTPQIGSFKLSSVRTVLSTGDKEDTISPISKVSRLMRCKVGIGPLVFNHTVGRLEI